MSIESTSYHEAGHVVMHVVRGVPLDRVTIIPNDDYNGCVQWNCGPSVLLNLNMGNNNQECRALAIDAILISLAGVAAEECFSGQYDEDGAASDMSSAYEIARHYSRNPHRYLQDKFRETRKIIRQNWRQVDQIANALLKHQTLDGDAVLDLLGIGV